ncbi:Uncharacterized protein Adt_31902 [Abeliophyllum distichum]|uniref:Gag-pol polyprotein n=1 Tax=Abeliophyllum distichum TaxID=126358 RepID=A0ABD1RFF5_9LAMI
MDQQHTKNSYLELKNTSEEATSDQENEKGDRRDNVKGKEKYFKSEKKESPKKALDFQHPGRPTPTLQRLQGYHILNTSLENVLMQTKGKDILKNPVPMRANSSKLNQRKYCRYHRSAGHDTDDCRDLKGEIESLIKRGHLKEFLARPAGGVELPPPQDCAELPHPLPQDRVSENNIHRTLVDDGSSVNVLYLRTFKQMEIDVRHVRPFPKPLQGFTGDYMNPKKQIALMVELGLPPCQRRIITDFMIVDLSSNYNAIMDD